MNPEEIVHRVKKVEDRLDNVSSRVDKLEERWHWITDTMGRLLSRMADISEKNTVILQRYDLQETLLTNVDRKVSTIEDKLTRLPCRGEEEVK